MLINEELTIHCKTAANRVLLQPMEGCDAKPDGSIGDLTARRYMRFAKSGAGIIWFEATAVSSCGRANARQLYLTQRNVAGYKALLNQIRQKSEEEFGYSPLIILQATHSGRYSKPRGVPEPIVAYRSAVYEAGREDWPYRVITDSECDALPDKFAKTAALAAQAGFDGVDVKCCHGYLLNEFLSAYDRTGKYAGPFERRTALYFACIDAVRAALPRDMFVTTRLSAYDGFAFPHGFGANRDNIPDLSEPKKILCELERRNMELVNITIGNPYLIPHVNRPFTGGPEPGAQGVERVFKITDELQKAFPRLRLVMSALTFPGVRAIEYAEECLKNTGCAFAGFGRMAFAYPDFYRDFLQNGRLDPNRVCIKCGNCSKMMRAGGVSGCPVRDREVYLPLFQKYVGSAK